MSGAPEASTIIDRNPILAEAISNDKFFNDIIMDDISQWDIIDEMMEDGIDATSFDIISDSDFENAINNPSAEFINQDDL